MSEITNEMFNLNQDALRDTSVKNVIMREYRSETTPTDNELNININVRDTSEWIDLSGSYLEISGTSKGTGGNSLASGAAATNSALENGVSSIFSTSRLRVSNTLVESNDVYSHINSFTKQLMNTADDYARSIALNAGFALDTTPQAVSDKFVLGGVAFDTRTVSDNPQYNSGFTTRKGQFGLTTAARKRSTFHLPLRTLFSFCSVSKVLKGCPVRIELVRRSLEQMMFGTTAEPFFSLDKISLWVPIVQPSLEVLAGLESELARGLSVPWSYVNWRTYASDASTATTRRWTYTTISEKPLGAFLVCKLSKAAGTNEKQFNNMIFDNADVRRAQIVVNGVRYPYQEYETNWSSGTNQDTSRVYAGLMEYMEKNKSELDGGSLINPFNHSSLYPFYYFNLHNLEETTAGHQISVEVDLNTAPAENMTMYLVVLSDTQFQVVGGLEGVQVLKK